MPAASNMSSDASKRDADTAFSPQQDEKGEMVRPAWVGPSAVRFPYAQRLALPSQQGNFRISNNAPIQDDGEGIAAPKPLWMQGHYPSMERFRYAQPLQKQPQFVRFGLPSSHDTPRMVNRTRELQVARPPTTQTDPSSTSVRDRGREPPYAQTLSPPNNMGVFSLSETSSWPGHNRNMEKWMSRDEELAAEPGVARLLSAPEDLEPLRLLVLPAEPGTESESGSVYAHLTAKYSFRLLNILPGRGEEPLRCQLRACSMLDNHRAYEALSYTWKTDSDSTMTVHPTIQCNGVEMTVGPNLYTALQHIRLEDKTRTVWVDAICINQEDVGERSEQVAAMGSIFRNAYRVLVWLDMDKDSGQLSMTGNDASASSRAFSAICAAVKTWAVGRGHAALSEPPTYLHRGSTKLFSASDRILSGEDIGEDTVWLDALRLYRKRWFSRLWVVQEIALARKATVVWGSCEISWEWIGLAAAIIRTNWNRVVPVWSVAQGNTHHGDLLVSNRLVPVGVMNAYFMYRISRSQCRFSPLQFSFLDLLTLTRQFQCEDKRDNIFGLLGLPTTDSVSSRIKPDYTQSLADTYRAVASALVCLPRSLSFLSHVHHKDVNDPLWLPESNSSLNAGEAVRALPSWVPQWHVVGPQSLAPLDPHSAFAAGMLQAAQFLPPDVTAATDRLIVRGMVLEDVTHTRGVGSLQPLGAELDGQSLQSMLEQSSHTRLGLEKLAVTLSAGKNWYGVPVAEAADVLSDFADCLVAGRLLWALKPDAFGVSEQSQVGERSRKFEDQGNAEGQSFAAELEERITVTALKNLAASRTGALFHDAVATACDGRRLFTTTSGLRGVGPLDMMPGDKVCVIYGTQVPFVLRQCEEKGGYTLVGECYIHDIMRGEALRWKGFEEIWIDLV